MMILFIGFLPCILSKPNHPKPRVFG